MYKNDDNTVMVIDGVHYELSAASRNALQRILSRARVVKDDRKTVAPATPGIREELTDAVVQRLVGHTNVVYYNCDTNAWNTDRYNGYKIGAQDMDTKRVKEFKDAMNKIPEFNPQYEFVAPVTMTIDGIADLGWGKQITNPQYAPKGTAVVGNIFVRNRGTGKIEMYCKTWVGVYDYSNLRNAVNGGACRFANYGAWDSVCRAALIVAHTR